jgi:phosphatidylglycerol:prolipoprotein diacylglycerol transferase
MHPVLVELPGGTRAIGSYGLLVLLGIAVAGGLAVRATARARLDVGAAFAVLALAVAGGLAGSWLTFALVELVRTGSLDAVARGGGLVFFGAVPGGLVAAWAGGRWLRLDVVRVLDLAAPGLAAGHALGRMGCFLGGCCFGKAFDGPWSVLYVHPLAPAAHPSVPRHPTPLYEAAGLLGIALVLAFLPLRRVGVGARAALLLALYAVLRVATELTRGDAVRGVLAGVSTSQAIAAIALVGASLWIVRTAQRAS